MAWLPISWTVPQYMDSNGDPYSGAVLKFYQDGTTTVTNMATSNTGGTQLTSVALNANGYPANGGSVFIPHIDQAYKVSLYPTQAAANANTGAIWTIDNLTPADLTDTDTDELTKVSSNDTTAGYLNGKLTGGAGITLTENDDGGNETFTIALNNIPEIATNHVRAANTQIINGDQTNTPIDVDSVVTESAFETVGPTGSGATNIWADMDSIPSTGAVLIVDVYLDITTSGTGLASVNCYACSNSVSPAVDLENNSIASVGIDSTASGVREFITKRAFIPLDSSQIFKVSWSDSGSSSTNVQLFYRGFITD